MRVNEELADLLSASKLEPSGSSQHQRNGDDCKRHDCQGEYKIIAIDFDFLGHDAPHYPCQPPKSTNRTTRL